MTREERLELLKQIEKDIQVCSLESTFLEDAKSCAIHSAIEELEQEPILDKIRAEIKKSSHGKWYVGRLDGKTEEVLLLDEVLQIIDKYKAESEPQESEVEDGNDV